MKIAVLPVSVSDRNRATTLTSAWIQRACGSVSAFIRDQSGGRQAADFTVFAWTGLAQTHQQWRALGLNVLGPVNAQASQLHQADLSGFDHYVYVIDDGVSTGGVTRKSLKTTIVAARDIDPALLGHEITHVFGAPDTFLDTPKGPRRYDALFCIMGREGSKHSFRDPGLLAPAEGAEARRTDCGPGLCVPSLLATGWLTLDQHGVKVTGVPGTTPAAAVTLRALDGAPRDDGGGPVCAHVDDGDRYLVEYRQARSRWDAGLPASAMGWLVVHRTPLDGPLSTLEVASFPVLPGKTVSFGGPDNIYLFGAGPLHLSVLACDADAGTVTLQFARRKGEVPQFIEPFRGFRQELRYGLWSPVSGWHGFEARSDLAQVLERIEALSQLRDLAQVSSREHAADLQAAADREQAALQAAARGVGEQGLVPQTSRTQLLAGLDQLHDRLTALCDFPELAGELARLQTLAREMG